MPHEYPNPVASNAIIRENNPSEVPAQNNKERTPPIMGNTEKENGLVPLGNVNVKVSIPDHIHDVNAKTFYKLGQFLGKVNVQPMILNILNLKSIYFREDLLHVIRLPQK